MSLIHEALSYILPFLVALTVLVFVHEFGHYWVAKRCGVKIDSFSIGFGKELFGWNDRSGTRWKFSALPLGGYVKMFGDTEETSWTDSTDLSHINPEDRGHIFAGKPLIAKAAIVAAGPTANFLFTIFLFSMLFATVGERFTTPVISQVSPGSAAEAAGIQPNDVFLSINGRSVQRFEDIQELVELNPEQPLTIALLRDGKEQTIVATPKAIDEKGWFGPAQKIGRLGIINQNIQVVRQPPLTAVVQAVRETWSMCDRTLVAVWQMIKGIRPADQLGGLVSIAKLSHDSAMLGFVNFVYFMALLSVNLGLINLFPIPVLDGGHLLFYAVEAVRGKPPGEAVMKYSFRFGLALVLTLAIFSNWNDLVHLGLLDFVRGLVS